MSSDSTLLQGELSRLSASISDETANQSRGTLSWRETLALEGSHDSAVTDRSVLPVLHEILSSDEDTSSKRLFMEEGASGLGPTGQGRSPTSACDYLSTTTISSGSFLTSERTDTSPVISAPSVATDISSQADHLSDTFHSLDPKLDSDISTPSYARSDATITPQSLPDLSRSSSNSSHREPQPYRSSPSSSGLFHSHVLARRSPRRPAKEGERAEPMCCKEQWSRDEHRAVASISCNEAFYT
ncbi:unnamed protein product, partial [Ranitomeya imitator]